MFSQEKDNWRGLNVKRDRRHEPLEEKLCTNRDGHEPVFRYIKDLMVFAAMVGFSLGKRKPLESDTVPITLGTYSTDSKDAFIYLVALVTERTGTILKDENLSDAIKIFEEYCNVGLDCIKLWFDENPGDHIGVDTLSEKIYEQVIENESSGEKRSNPEDLDPGF